MTTELDKEARQIAKEILDEFGKNNGSDGSVIWRKMPRSGYDLATSTQPPSGPPDDYDIRIAPPFPVRDDYVDGDTVKSTDLEFFVEDALRARMAQVPIPDFELDDRYIIDGVEYQTVAIHPVHSGDLIAGRDIVVRKGTGNRATVNEF